MPPVYSVDWFSRNIPQWEKLFQSIAHKPGLRMVEVGTYEGRSACWLLEHVLTHPSSQLVCIDTFELLPAAEEVFRKNIRDMGAEDRIVLRKENSTDALRNLPAQSFDAVYIDGSHEAADVLSDGVHAWALLKTGGLLIFDDYSESFFEDAIHEPSRAIDAFLYANAAAYDLVERKYQVVLRKKERVPAKFRTEQYIKLLPSLETPPTKACARD